MQTLSRAVATIRHHWPRRATFGLVLGSGLGSVADLVTQPTELSYESIPGFPSATAQGHAGKLLLGEIGNVPAVVLQGRFHRYEGHSTATLMLPVRVMRELGVELMVLTNASGGLNPSFQPGDVMLIRDHLSMQWLERESSWETNFGRRPAAVYDEALCEQAMAIARRAQLDLKQGVYVGVPGPNYETRAEYRMFRRIGGDAVGMSTIAEAVAGAEAGIRVAGLSLIANVALPDAPEKVAHDQVLRAVAGAADKVRSLVSELVTRVFHPAT